MFPLSFIWGLAALHGDTHQSFKGELGRGKTVHADHRKVLRVAEEMAWTVPEGESWASSEPAGTRPSGWEAGQTSVRAMEPRRGIESRRGPPASMGPLAHYLSCPVLVLLAK